MDIRKFLTALIAVLFLAPVPALASSVLCSCVRYVQTLGVPLKGDARVQIPNTPLSDIQEGDVLLTRYGKVSHVSYVVKVENGVDRMIDEQSFTTKPVAVTVREANYHHCKAGTRTIALNDVHIKGVLRLT